ncbi:MAG TPA: hypothetical protein VGE40_14235, partial [Bacilli bacterium]
LFHMLSGSQLDFDYGDEDMIQRLYSIDTSKKNEPILWVGQAAYKIVIVSGMTTIRSTTLRILQLFMEAGGKVVFAGELPHYVDALESVDAGKIAARAIQVPFDKKLIVEACEPEMICRVHAADRNTGEGIEDIFCQVRLDGDKKYVFMVNVNRAKSYPNVVISITGDGNLQEWNCITGDRSRIPADTMNGTLEFAASFPASGEHLYVITPAVEMELPEKLDYNETVVAAWHGPFEYKLSEPNICVLDLARYRLQDGEWQAEREILKVDRAVRRKLGLDYRGGAMIQPWYARKEVLAVKGQLSLCFEFNVGEIPEKPLELVMERPGNFTIYFNGYLLETNGLEEWWIDKCFKKIVIPTRFLVSGVNTVELETDFHQGIDLEALYLIGEFGVELDGSRKTLITLPELITMGDLTMQGLPFYSGVVTYILKMEEVVKNDDSDSKKRVLFLPGFEAACVKVRSGLGEPRMIAWQPYSADITAETGADFIELDVVLTRRNTFGPLHLVPVHSLWYGPEQWVSEGEEFSLAYKLIPSGLLEAPRLCERVTPHNQSPDHSV